MNGHNTEGVEAYGPGDGIGLMAAILATHDEGDDPAWFQAIGDGDPLPIDPICPFCGWALIPVEDGRMICPDCGAAFNGAAELAQASDLMALSPHDEDDAPDPAVLAAELAALNGVRFTITPEFDAVGRLAGHEATATDWDGGFQWTL